jgi:hypothetical protein
MQNAETASARELQRETSASVGAAEAWRRSVEAKRWQCTCCIVLRGLARWFVGTASRLPPVRRCILTSIYHILGVPYITLLLKCINS